MKSMGYLFNSDKNIILIICLNALLEYNNGNIKANKYTGAINVAILIE